MKPTLRSFSSTNLTSFYSIACAVWRSVFAHLWVDSTVRSIYNPLSIWRSVNIGKSDSGRFDFTKWLTVRSTRHFSSCFSTVICHSVILLFSLYTQKVVHGLFCEGCSLCWDIFPKLSAAVFLLIRHNAEQNLLTCWFQPWVIIGLNLHTPLHVEHRKQSFIIIVN